MKKRVAFFGDSFVGRFSGWVRHFCNIYGYKCKHTGKMGADQFYPLQKWIEFNESYKDTPIDLCVYAHTEPHRLYHPDKDVPLTLGTVGNFNKVKRQWTEEQRLILKAAEQYFLHLEFSTIGDLKGIIVPMGIDQYFNQNNRAFQKIIHIWSFAPCRMHDNIDDDNFFAQVSWPFEMTSGMNIKLDLSNLSLADPNNKKESIDSRPLHFSYQCSPFVAEILAFADKFYERGKTIDFTPYIVKQDPKWDDYVDAFKQIKSKLNENINNRQQELRTR